MINKDISEEEDQEILRIFFSSLGSYRPVSTLLVSFTISEEVIWEIDSSWKKSHQHLKDVLTWTKESTGTTYYALISLLKESVEEKVIDDVLSILYWSHYSGYALDIEDIYECLESSYSNNIDIATVVMVVGLSPQEVEQRKKRLQHEKQLKEEKQKREAITMENLSRKI